MFFSILRQLFQSPFDFSKVLNFGKVQNLNFRYKSTDMNSFQRWFACFLLASCFTSFTRPVNTSSRKLIWSDEFNYTGLPDPAKWIYDQGGDGWGNNELEFYTTNRKENARVENGNLIIEARKE